MNGKILLGFAVIFVVQAISPDSRVSTPEVEKDVFQEMSQTNLSLYYNRLMEIYPSSADAQKSIETISIIWSKVFTDLLQMETEANKIKEIASKNDDPKSVENFEKLEGGLKSYLISFIDNFEENVKRMEMEKIADNVTESIKDVEASENKDIDGFKKQ